MEWVGNLESNSPMPTSFKHSEASADEALALRFSDSPRQREVLQLFAEGRSAKEVAAVLKISIRTAEAHKARILEALGLRTTAELVQFAIRTGITSV